MKKSFNVLIAVSALLLALCLSACSTASGGGSSSGSAVAVFTCIDSKGTTTFSFYEDATWVAHAKGEDHGFEIDLDGDAGTYTGDPTQDGDCTIKCTKEADVMSAYLELMFSGKTSGKITNANAPLKTLPESEQETETITIKDGKFAWQKYKGEIYTRK